MKLLVLGGTLFLGRWLVQAALDSGHQVTLFNRGKSNPELFPEVEKLHGDRGSDLSALHGCSWDAVIDTCGYVPRIVRSSVELTSGFVDHYAFISSLSVYADFSRPNIDESGEVGALPDPTIEEINGETYGPLKAACEQVVLSAFPDRSLVLRPGLIVGPYDPSDRFTYWPHRVARGGEVLAPGRPERTIQFIDVRDLAEWTIRMVTSGEVGVYNANGPQQPIPMSDLLAISKEISGSSANFTWASEAFLMGQKVGDWIEMPLWVPESSPEYAGFFAINSSKAIASGLRFRTVSDTVRATLEWDLSLPTNRSLKAGIPPEREADLLAKWHEAVEPDQM